MSPPADSSKQTGSVEGERRLKPVARRKLADLAYDAVRESIISGRFAMGERLVETTLAKELEMSRAPVREAMRRLREEGLIVERAHHGMFVRSFSEDEIIDVYNLRLALEVAALRLFVRQGAATEPLRAHIERRREAARAGDVSAVVAADFAFHEEVFLGSGNDVLFEAFRRLAAQTLIAIVVDDAALDLEQMAEEHVPVVAALERGDEEGAVAAFVEVVATTVNRLAPRLGRDPAAFLGNPPPGAAAPGEEGSAPRSRSGESGG